MKTTTKLIIAGIALFLIPLGGITQVIGTFCIVGGIILIIVQNVKGTPKQKGINHGTKE